MGLFGDDSGLFIDSLNGFAGVSSDFVHSQIGSLGILDLMKGREERGAEFRTCAILWDGEEFVGEGICRGRIIAEERGENGFGYDPIFVPDDLGGLSSEGRSSDSGASDSGTTDMLTSEGRTFAELETAEKNSFSHRRKALEAVLNRLR